MWRFSLENNSKEGKQYAVFCKSGKLDLLGRFDAKISSFQLSLYMLDLCTSIALGGGFNWMSRMTRTWRRGLEAGLPGSSMTACDFSVPATWGFLSLNQVAENLANASTSSFTCIKPFKNAIKNVLSQICGIWPPGTWELPKHLQRNVLISELCFQWFLQMYFFKF